LSIFSDDEVKVEYLDSDFEGKCNFF